MPLSETADPSDEIKEYRKNTLTKLAGRLRTLSELRRALGLSEWKESVPRHADLVKIDAEGHEAEILRATRRDDWRGMDVLVEVGSPENAAVVFEHGRELDLHLFAQKQNWERVTSLADMPTSYRDGTLFISRKPAVPWEEPA